MIGMKIAGGLGNQMFQYAFIANKSLKTKSTFYLDKNGSTIELYKYFTLKKNLFYYIDKIFFHHEGYKLFFSHYLRTAFYSLITKVFIKNYVSSPRGSDQPETLSPIEEDTYFNGFYQSPFYFKDHEAEIIKYFTLKSRIKVSYSNKYAFLQSEGKIVTVHIRKTDFTNLGNYNLGIDDLSLPFSYYHNLIKNIHQDENYYVIISDDPKLIETEFNYLTKKHISNDSEIVDFQHMLNADICVIANSTFSWWAAYLNKNKQAVYCPEYFLGYNVKRSYPIALYPESWIKVH